METLPLYGPITVISGGQTGADLGGLLAAESCGIHTTGWAPKFFKTEKGNKPILGSRFGLIEHGQQGYPPRTSDNVRDSHVTIIVSTNPSSPGTQKTISLCDEHDKAYYLISDVSDQRKAFIGVLAFLQLHRARVINVAGNRESVSRGLTVLTKQILHLAFKQYKIDLVGHISKQEEQGVVPLLYPELPIAPEVPKKSYDNER